MSGAQITRVCRSLARLATNLDLTENLVERSALIQQLVLLPSNAFFVSGIRVDHSLIMKMSYVIVAATIFLARDASITKTAKGQL